MIEGSCHCGAVRPGPAVTDEYGLGEDYLVKEYLKGTGLR